jgi:tetratricopeptide (TPR) repeat protein
VKISSKVYPFLILLAGGLAYASSFNGVFIIDDGKSIEENPRIRHILPVGKAEWCERSLVATTFAVNYAEGRLNPADYHATNLLIHLIAGLLLFGIVRRTLCSYRMPQWFRGEASGIAFVAAAIWTVHPLATSAVTYISQRYESMMAMFYLMTLYCVIRGAQNGHGKSGWYLLAVTAGILGAGCKEVMVTAPFVVLVYDIIFLSGSLKETIARRWGLYAGLCFIYVLLAIEALFIVNAPGDHSVGRLSLSYLVTQCGVIVRYLRLSVWPSSLCVDYGWHAPALGAAIPSILFICGLGCATLIALRFVPPIGFLGFWFFAVLAPSSSIIARPDAIFEHRMYLPLAAIAAGIAIAGFAAFRKLQDNYPGHHRLAERLTVMLCAAVIVSLTATTYLRNKDYCSPQRILGAAIEKYPDNIRPYVGLSRALYSMGRYDEAISCCEKALSHLPDLTKMDRAALLSTEGRSGEDETFLKVLYYSKIQNNLALSLQKRDMLDEAIRHFQEALRLAPGNLSAQVNLASALFCAGRKQEAINGFRQALSIAPDDVGAQQSLGEALFWTGDISGAIKSYNSVLKLDPDNMLALIRLARILAICSDDSLRDGKRAAELAFRALESVKGNSAELLDILAAAYAETGEFEKAVKTARKALELAGAKEKNGVEERLALYVKGMPYRDSFQNIGAVKP